MSVLLAVGLVGHRRMFDHGQSPLGLLVAAVSLGPDGLGKGVETNQPAPSRRLV